MALKIDDSSSDSSKCHLLSLPAELRNRIYDYVLVEAGPIKVHGHHFRIREPSIASTNRQLRSESLPIFYGANTFQLRLATSVDQFLTGLDPKRLPLLRRIELGFDEYRQKFPLHWYLAVRRCLRSLNRMYVGKGLGRAVIKMPLALGGYWAPVSLGGPVEVDTAWVDAQTIGDFDLENDTNEADAIIVRK